MTNNQKREVWTYVIALLLVINLFVINNFITNKAIKIIKTKDNNTTASMFNIDALKTGVINKYSSIVTDVKSMAGMSTVTEVNETNISIIDVNSTIISSATINGQTGIVDNNLSIPEISSVPKRSRPKFNLAKNQPKGGSL